MRLISDIKNDHFEPINFIQVITNILLIQLHFYQGVDHLLNRAKLLLKI